MSFERHDSVEAGDLNSEDSHSEYDYEQINPEIALSDNDQNSMSDISLPLRKKSTLDSRDSKNKKTLKKSSMSSNRYSKAGLSLYFKSAPSFGSK